MHAIGVYMFCASYLPVGRLYKMVVPVCSSHRLVTPVSLLSLFRRAVPLRRPELEIYCVLCTFDRVSSKHYLARV